MNKDALYDDKKPHESIVGFIIATDGAKCIKDANYADDLSKLAALTLINPPKAQKILSERIVPNIQDVSDDDITIAVIMSPPAQCAEESLRIARDILFDTNYDTDDYSAEEAPTIEFSPGVECTNHSAEAAAHATGAPVVPPEAKKLSEALAPNIEPGFVAAEEPELIRFLLDGGKTAAQLIERGLVKPANLFITLGAYSNKIEFKKGKFILK